MRPVVSFEAIAAGFDLTTDVDVDSGGKITTIKAIVSEGGALDPEHLSLTQSINCVSNIQYDALLNDASTVTWREKKYRPVNIIRYGNMGSVKYDLVDLGDE